MENTDPTHKIERENGIIDRTVKFKYSTWVKKVGLGGGRDTGRQTNRTRKMGVGFEFYHGIYK